MKKYYMCGVTFKWELGETNIDGFIYDSIEEIKKGASCWEDCGIVEIEVEDGKLPESYSSHKWVVPEDMDRWRTTRAEVPGTGKTADEIRREED